MWPGSQKESGYTIGTFPALSEAYWATATPICLRLEPQFVTHARFLAWRICRAFLGGNKGLALAFLPLCLMPETDRSTLTKIELPTVVDKPNRAVLGFPLGYYYLYGADPEKCRKIMLSALDMAGFKL